MKIKQISIKYKDYIDINVFESFPFPITIRTIDNVETDEEYRIKGKYVYDTTTVVTAGDILRHNYPKDACFILKMDTNYFLNIPLENLECKCVGEYNF
jgi:hypothetical protein